MSIYADDGVLGSNSSDHCVFHMLALFANHLPTHYIVLAVLVVAFLVVNCVYALIVNRRQIVSTTVTLPRHDQQQQQQQQGHSGQRADEHQPLITTTT